MQREDASARARVNPEMGPLVIRPSDPRVSSKGSPYGNGPLVIDYGPPKPIPEAMLELVREKIRQANTLPADVT